MKQMTKKEMKVLNKVVSGDLIGTFQVSGDEDVAACVVQYRRRISMEKMLMMVDTVAYAATCDEDYNPIARDMMLSRFILEYFTNIPVPMDKQQGDSQVADLAKCYAYVFQTGLYQQLMVDTELPFIEGYIDKRLAFAIEEQHGMNHLAGKVEQLLEEALVSWRNLSAQIEAQAEMQSGQASRNAAEIEKKELS